MNKKILKMILGSKKLFVPLVLTEKQYGILEKYEKGKPLKNSEKKSLYTSIKRKMEALNLVFSGNKEKEYFITGHSNILLPRIDEAKKILDEYSAKYSKVFIGGSFLFSEEFNDLDIFIMSKRGYKEEWDSNRHLIFLSERRLRQPQFQSVSLISISNFIITSNVDKKIPKLSTLMSTYHEAVIEKIKKEKKPEAVRRLIFDYNLFCNNNLLNPKELKEKSDSIFIGELDSMIKSLLLSIFSKSYLYVDLHSYIKTLKESVKKISPNNHLMHFIKTYEETIYGQRESKAEIG